MAPLIRPLQDFRIASTGFQRLDSPVEKIRDGYLDSLHVKIASVTRHDVQVPILPVIPIAPVQQLPNAEKLLMDDPKETVEHATIVDLIRNDLSMVAEQVRVVRYRYCDRLETNKIGRAHV